MKRSLLGKEFGIFVLLVVLCGVVSVLNHQFFSIENVQNTARLVGLYGIFSLGLGVVVITGGIDLSVGSAFALLGVLLSLLLTRWHWPGAASVAGIVALGASLGVLHGFLITRIRLQPFIVTLCGLLIYRGLARLIASDETKGFGNAEGFAALPQIATGSVAGVPIPFLLLLVLAAVLWVALHRSAWGRHLFALGKNEDAARYSGVNTRRLIAGAYVLCGAMTGLASVILAFYTNSISPSSHGNSYELYGIAAAVLGGCSLRGGEGSVIGILLGTVLLQVLRNLIILLDIPSSLDFAVMGAVILIGVTLDQLVTARRLRTAK